METLLPTRRTTPTKIDFARALLAVWPDATKEGAGVLYAHFAGETGDGAYCWNWNLGNVKHAKGDGFDYVSLRGVWEGFRVGDEDGDGDVDADDRAILVARLLRSGMWEPDPSVDHARAVGPTKVSLVASPENAATHFKAYASLAVGMHFFVEGKRKPSGRYASAWAFVVAGDPEGYGRELGAKGYYTASPDAYARAMRKKFDAWMASTDFEGAQDETPTDPRGGALPPTSAPAPEILAAPVVPLAVVSAPDLLPARAIDEGLVEVALDGEVWLVSPVYIAPVGIGQAGAVAKQLGYELPTPALVDAIWRAADLRVPPHLMIRSHDGVHMDTPELHAKQQEVLAAYIGPRALGLDYRLLAGAFKDVVLVDGKPGIYGWHADERGAAKLGEKGVPTYAPATAGEGVVVQRANAQHGEAWRDYSQGLRLCKRKV